MTKMTIEEARTILIICVGFGVPILHINKLKSFLESQEKEKQELKELVKNQSDGYHTFAELYNHRHTLFCQLCNIYSDVSWKSKLHSDGTMFENWFIAGIQTPQGQATYHLPISWWNKFVISELEKAPEWDGHTSDDVIHRLSLPLGNLLDEINELKAELDKWKPKFEIGQ